MRGSKTKGKKEAPEDKLRPASSQLRCHSRPASATAAPAKAGTGGCPQEVTEGLEPTVFRPDSTQGHNCQTFQANQKRWARAVFSPT